MLGNAITRRPAKTLKLGITSAGLGPPDYELAKIQYQKYVDTLKTTGLTVIEMEEADDYPDSVFVEDTAIVTPEFAVVTRPGARTRRGETESMADLLEEIFPKIHRIEGNATLDGGDVMQVGTHYYIGLSHRTNPEGIHQLVQILESYGCAATVIAGHHLLHLKTGISYLNDNYILVEDSLSTRKELSHFDRIVVSREEAYAANSLWINGTVLVPAGFPRTKRQIEGAGFDTLEVEMSEFRKLDGGLSCLSLRY